MFTTTTQFGFPTILIGTLVGLFCFLGCQRPDMELVPWNHLCAGAIWGALPFVALVCAQGPASGEE